MILANDLGVVGSKGKGLLGLLVVVTVIFVGVRWFSYDSLSTCSTDQGLHLLETWKMDREGKIPLIGPPSSFSVNGRAFFFGPVTYYLGWIALKVGGWQQASVASLLTLLQLVSVGAVLWVLAQQGKAKTGLLFALVFALMPLTVHYSRFYWNPNFMLPVASLVLATLLAYEDKSKNSKLLSFLLGLWIGLGLQFHYNFLMVMPLVWYWLMRRRLINVWLWVYLIPGLVLGLLPLVVFDLRHEFYNLRTVELMLTSGQGDKSIVGVLVNPPEYYWLPLAAFAAYGLAVVTRALMGKQWVFGVGVLSVAMAVWYVGSLPKQGTGYLMPDNWTCESMEKMKDIVVEEGKERFNLIDVYTGDSRAMYLRALLTLEGHAPMEVDEYPIADYVYIYTKLPAEQVINMGMWETEAMRPATLVGKWQIEKEVWLYLFKRETLEKVG